MNNLTNNMKQLLSLILFSILGFYPSSLESQTCYVRENSITTIQARLDTVCYFPDRGDLFPMTENSAILEFQYPKSANSHVLIQLKRIFLRNPWAVIEESIPNSILQLSPEQIVKYRLQESNVLKDAPSGDYCDLLDLSVLTVQHDGADMLTVRHHININQALYDAATWNHRTETESCVSIDKKTGKILDIWDVFDVRQKENIIGCIKRHISSSQEAQEAIQYLCFHRAGGPVLSPSDPFYQNPELDLCLKYLLNEPFNHSFSVGYGYEGVILTLSARLYTPDSDSSYKIVIPWYAFEIHTDRTSRDLCSFLTEKGKKYIAPLFKFCADASIGQIQKDERYSNQSKGQTISQEQLRRTYRGQLEAAASQMTQKLMRDISPQSGKEARYVLDLESIHYDEETNMVSSKVLLIWQAREFMANISYGECQVSGTLQVYMPIRTIDSTKAILRVDKYNEHLKKVSMEKDRAKLNRGIVIVLN